MPNRPLSELEQRDDFISRHIGLSDDDVAEMLEVVGTTTMEDLIGQTVPSAICSPDPLELPGPRTEAEVLEALRGIADQNEVFTSLIGTGYSGTIVPPVILRNVLENPGWYTAYTPYQPEISQGRLEALLNFQTMISDLTGLEIANASLLDEGTAAAEAMALCQRQSKSESNVFFVDRDCHPQTIAVIETRAEPIGIKVMVGDPYHDLDGNDVYGVLFQYPGSGGEVRDHRALIAELKAAGVLVAMATDLLALTLLTPPGELGADIAVGSSQRFGVPFGFGGPHAGFLSTHESFKRTLPGRLVGVSVDDQGRQALRLALQTREQHIRREKATSNICTAQVLLANMAGFYATYHGSDGLRTIAERVHRLTGVLAAGLRGAGIEVDTAAYFDTITVRVPGRAAELLAAARDLRINLRPLDADTVGISLDETTGRGTVSQVWAAFGVEADIEALDATVTSSVPEALVRTSSYLDHPVFKKHRSETGMLRYLRYLMDKDIALDRSMIPLGSCTMKLNATTEMIPVTWPEFADIHPFAPNEQTAGYRQIIHELESMLVELTGYHSVSVQPNAGSQGEFAGLLAIRRYHESRGENARTVCLIPSSAHGTNAASAVMAGMRVVVVPCDDQGNIDVDELIAKAVAHTDSLAALMVTYPSTHGVFETRIREICGIVHDHGGQVYLDGANLNALVGVAKPGHFGADVSHLNLHKTFSIPHGGGGPGVGPVAVGEHLADFLPNHPLNEQAGPESGPGPISAAPWGSAGILPISWTYVTLMGGTGLTQATHAAILAANYLAVRLSGHYPVLYTGEHGRVAHECIIDLRPISADTGVSVDDVAKRLMDYGFHAPTMSFPVAGTLMIEPTESESKAELDRFVAAMIAIRAEIDRVGEGEWPVEQSPLRLAPHTADDVVADVWDRPYGRELAAYPVASLRDGKYWPPVGRIDGVHGDRNLVCSCPPPEAFED